MKLLGAAAVAATIAFACSAAAADCELNQQLDHAKEVASAALASKRFDAYVDLTGDDLAAFIKASNAQFQARIPEDGSLDEGLVISVDGTVHFFGFAKGCQVGTVVLPEMPAKMSAPALLPHGLRLI